MATVHRRPVYGRRVARAGDISPADVTRSDPSSSLNRSVWSAAQLSSSQTSSSVGPTSVINSGSSSGSLMSLSAKPDEFVYYSESDDESDAEAASSAAAAAAEALRKRRAVLSRSFVDYHVQRQCALIEFGRLSLDHHYATRHLLGHTMLHESPVNVSGLNKVFSSQWLGDDQIVFGTKCNKILVYNVRTHSMDVIPRLMPFSSGAADPSGALPTGAPGPGDSRGGVYSLSVNPSRTLLATSAENCSDLAVYRLPTLDPVCVGQGGHTDWIYSSVWLDDCRVVTGGRDTCISLWHVNDDSDNDHDADCICDVDGIGRCRCRDSDTTISDTHYICDPVPRYSSQKPLITKRCKTADKVRSLVYNTRDNTLVGLSVNAYVHLFDVYEFRQKISRRLPHSMDNVCLALSEQHQVYAVGSKSHTTLLDPRSLKVLKKIPAKYHGCGIRSLSFHGDLVTIGMGNSVLMFYDLRTQKYLDSGVSAGRAVVFKAGAGWSSLRAVSDNVVIDGAGGVQIDHTPAIYTHCYDASGTRLFTAGGPLSVDVDGCYAGVWM